MQIEHGHALQGIVPFIMVFYAIWWAWMNFTWFASAYDTDDVPYRLLSLLQMGGVLVLAAGVPGCVPAPGFLRHHARVLHHAHRPCRAVGSRGDRESGWPNDGPSLCGAVSRSCSWAGWPACCSRRMRADEWWTVYLAFVVLVVLEFLVPYLAERTGMTTWHPHHIAERYGLFAIILLGETIAVLAAGVSAT